MIAPIEGKIVTTLHMNQGMMIATIKGETVPTLLMTLGMNPLITIDIVQSLEALHHLEGAQGGAILVASLPSKGEA